MERLTEQQIKDMKVLVQFVRVYCRARHGDRETTAVELSEELVRCFPGGVALCAECAGLVAHAAERRRKCPLDPKPSCKHCHIHCYSKEYRARIREIMAFSGRRMIMRGRIDYLWHYFF